MTVIDQLDPELLPVVRQVPRIDLSDIPEARRALHAVFAQVYTAAPDPIIERADHVAQGSAGRQSAIVRVFKPAGTEGALPCLYWIQGGGYVLTNINFDDQWCEQVAKIQQCVVASVDWRRAPEHRYPAAIDDCYTGLSWIVAEAEMLGIDPDKVVIGGASSGGGAAAALALQVTDRKELRVEHQLLIYPMLDDTNSTRSSQAVTDPELWNLANNRLAWEAYLGDAYGTDRVSPYAAPARREHLSGLPPATILTGELDLFVDEDIVYAQRLMHAGVPTELHVYPGAHHGFDRHVPTAAVSRRLIGDRDAALARAFAAISPKPSGVDA